jgi:hypothetical protein
MHELLRASWRSAEALCDMLIAPAAATAGALADAHKVAAQVDIVTLKAQLERGSPQFSFKR